MSYEPLHHKYRPQSFTDLVGQEAIAKTLINAIMQEKIAPAYLFTGPRGTGKTSSARILAKSLNCLASSQPTPNPCGKCEVCEAIARGTALDVIEIDAASNTGVDNIREIIERSQFAPVQCRYKVYVIDECHMLSTAAFNALLKTLEEPPLRVVFVLATTDPQRVLSTIISRCQRFDYRRIPLESMVAHLKYIATEEAIDITPEAITLVAQIANGGLRDAESLLDQLSLLPDKVTVEQVWDLVGAVREQDLLSLLKAIAADDPESVLQQCRHLLNRGREPLVVLQNLASFYLNLLIAKTAPQRFDLVAVTETTWQALCTEAQQWQLALILGGQQRLKEAETQIKNTTQPRLWLEVTLLGLLPASLTLSNTITVASSSIQTPKSEPQRSKAVSSASIAIPQKIATTVNQKTTEPALSKTTDADSKQKAQSSPVPSSVSNRENGKTAPQPTTPQPDQEFEPQQIWQEVIERSQPPTTKALLRQKCHLISLEESIAIVGISSPQLLKLLLDKIFNIEAAFASVCQRQIKVKLEVATAVATTNKAATSTKPAPSPSPPPLPKPENTSTFSNSSQAATTPRNFKANLVSEPKENNQEPPPVSVRDQDEIESDIYEPIVDGQYSQTDLDKAVEILAKNFDGEIVNLSGLTDEEEEDSPQEQLSVIADTNLSSIDSPTQHQAVLRGRPNLSDYNNDDVPF